MKRATKPAVGQGNTSAASAAGSIYQLISSLMNGSNFNKEYQRRLGTGDFRVPSGVRETKEVHNTELASAIRASIKREENEVEPPDQANIVDLAAAEQSISFAGDVDLNQSTYAHKLCLCLSPEEYHHYVQIIIQLGKGNIFGVKNAIGDTAIHNAFRMGLKLLPSTIDLLAEKCQFDFDTTNNKESTVLHLAATTASSPTLERIVHYGGYPKSRNVKGYTPLHSAFLCGNSEAVQYFMSRETPLHIISLATRNLTDIKDRFGPAVHLAAEFGNVEALRYLISLGADVNNESATGETPLHRARLTKYNFRETLSILKTSGADVNAVSKAGLNLVHYLAQEGRDVEDLKFVVEEIGCKWQAKIRSNGETALRLAAANGNYQAVEYLLSLFANANDKKTEEMHLLVQLCFAKHNFIETLNVLKRSGADINACDRYGDTLLLSSVRIGRSLEDIQEVVKLGGDLNAKNKKNRSALHQAALSGNVEVLEYLISQGGDVNEKDKFGLTAVPLSIRSKKGNHLEIIQVLLKHGVKLDRSNDNAEQLLLWAVKKGKTNDELDKIVDLGTDLTAVDENGRSLLHSMVVAAEAKLVQYLISKGADIHLKDNEGRTPLHLCPGSTGHFMTLVDLLLRHGAEINATDNCGMNLLLLAAENGKMKKDLRELVKLGADWKATDILGQSILHVLAKQGNPNALGYFISLGANVNARNLLQETPLHCVRDKKRRFIATYNVLVDNGVDMSATDISGRTAYAPAAIIGERWHLLNVEQKIYALKKLGWDIDIDLFVSELMKLDIK